MAEPEVVRLRTDSPAEAVADLLDRVVHRGAVVTGDVIISLAGLDLVRLDLRLLLLGLEEAPG
ncbi:gas vesicle protein GvpJ [Amycolatopsis sp. SID8362]|uniref:gas vesicle protein GvpJ n=1 Tax=Amycolatopsis sp. SID8362 TaxID=2690346 RepID=UPI00136DB5E3|nr:gas vesicle protein GvpJ [Amycolatopsis sp. SID8362]NBH01860.1 gas vesicle protein [Amycolatopsis sp. SID8362]NED38562.1 gas vesicle protein [Amycolatopsis sp. SID8362]